MSDNEQTTSRTELRQRLPWWLRGWLGGRLAYAIGIVIDVIADMLGNAVSLRFPLADHPDALALIGADRKIPRGPNESATIYLTRLLRWLDDHRTRGGPYAMLAQLHAYWSAAPFAIELQYQLGMTFNMAADGTVTRVMGGPVPGYDWPNWWLYYSWPTPLTNDGTWASSGSWSDGGVWDSSLTPDQVADVRCVPTAWNAAHASGMVVLQGPDSSTNQIAINQQI